MRTCWYGKFLVKSLRFPIRVADWAERIHVSMPLETRQAIARGGVVVFSNHPSLIETFVLWHRLDALTTRAVWTVTDEHLFPASWWQPLRCIVVSRGKVRKSNADRTRATDTNCRAVQQFERVLTEEGLVVYYPEGTRTCNATQHTALADREIGSCCSSLLRRAQRRGATLVPVWVDHGACDAPQGWLHGYRKLLWEVPITLTFGQPFTGPATSLHIAEALLMVGQNEWAPAA